MATSTSLGRSGPHRSLFFLIITVLSFSGTSLAATPLAILRRQPQPLPECVQMCTPPANEMGTFCKLSGSEKLERLKQCANGLCQGNEEQVQQVVVLNVGLCNEGITAPASVDIATVTSLLADTGATRLPPATTPTTTTTTISSTSSASVTPTANANSSNDDSSGGRTKESKKGSDLSIPIIVAIAVGGTVFLSMCVGLWYLLRCLKKRKRREREQKNGGAKGFDNSSISDLDNGSKRGIPLGNASRKEIGRGVPWIDEENNNSSTTQLYNTSAIDKPRRLPPISTKFAPSVPQRPSDRSGNNSSGDVSPVSPVSPLSEYATYDERRSQAISTVSSMKPERTHRDFYSVSSPPLPTPASAISSRYPSTRLPSKNKPANLNIGTGITDRPESEYPPEPVSPLSRNPSGKSIGARSEVSAIGEEHFAWESYRDTIRKYEEQQAQGKPISPEVIQRLSGLSQFNFGFGESQSPVESEKKRESSFYGWAPEKSSGGHLDVPSGQNRDKYLSGSSSVYSSQPMTPPPPINRDTGPSTPEMFFGRPPPSYTPPSPPPATASRSFIGVRQPSSHKPEPPTGGLAKANSLRWRREVEAATDQALKKIADPNDDKGESQQKSSGFWSLLTPKLSGASPKIGKVPSGTGSVNEGSWPNVAHQAASSEVSLVSEDGRSGVVII